MEIIFFTWKKGMFHDARNYRFRKLFEQKRQVFNQNQGQSYIFFYGGIILNIADSQV